MSNSKTKPKKPIANRPGTIRTGYQVYADLIGGIVGHRLVPEYRIGQRRYLWDYAVPRLRVVIEIQGGIWSRGSHGRGSGINRDMDKINYASTHGWRPLQYTPQEFGEVDGVANDLRAINQEEGTYAVNMSDASRHGVRLGGCVVVGSYDHMSDEEWLNLRRSGLGGSDAGGVMGMSKYVSPLGICMTKTGQMKEDDVGDFEAVKIGNLLEPLIRKYIIASYIHELTGKHTEVIEPTCMYRSKTYPWMIANVDGFLRFLNGEIVGLEIKTGSSYVLREWGGTKSQDEIPGAYYCQVQHYIAVTGLDRYYAVGLLGNQRILRVVPADPDFISELIERERKLWQIINHNDPLQFPEPSGMESDERAIEALSLSRDEGTADLSQVAKAIQDYTKLGEKEKRIRAERNTAKQLILATLGIHKYGAAGNYKVTYTRVSQTRLDAKRLDWECPKYTNKRTADNQKNGSREIMK